MSEIDAKREALKLVREHNEPLLKTAMDYINKLPVGWRGLSEDIREVLERDVMFLPTSSNFYGCMINAALRRGLLRRSGEFKAMQRKGSHARMTPLLERTYVGVSIGYSFQSIDE